MKNIKQITTLETFPLRYTVLRAKKPVESCHFDSQTFETTIHSGLYDSNNLFRVIFLFEAKNDSYTTEK